MLSNVFAVVDVGSNSTHLLMAASDGVAVVPVAEWSRRVGLAADIETAGFISTHRAAAVADAVAAYIKKGRRLGATCVEVVGTHALRAATNAVRVVEAIEERADCRLRVLSPYDEAHLAVLGVGLDCAWKGPALVADIGGGSVQIARVGIGGIEGVSSVGLGTGRCAARLCAVGTEQGALCAMRAALWPVLREAMAQVRSNETGAWPLVVTGGAIRRLWREAGSGETLTADEVAGLARALACRRSGGDEAEGVGSRRLLTLAGALILGELLSAAGRQQCRVSRYSLREGAVLALARGFRGGDGLANEEAVRGNRRRGCERPPQLQWCSGCGGAIARSN